MDTYFETETDVNQNLIDDFLIVTLTVTGLSIGRVLNEKGGGERGYFLKRRKFCMQSLTKERKQPPVVILQQAIFYNIFILCFWLKVVRRTNQSVWFINFPSQIFFYDVNHGHRAAILKKLFLAASVLYGCGYNFIKKVDSGTGVFL